MYPCNIKNPKKLYRCQDSARDFADLILCALWSSMKLERVHLEVLQFPGLLCSVHLKVPFQDCRALCTSKKLQFPRLCVLSALNNAAISSNCVLYALKSDGILRIFVLWGLSPCNFQPVSLKESASERGVSQEGCQAADPLHSHYIQKPTNYFYVIVLQLLHVKMLPIFYICYPFFSMVPP